MNCNENGLNQDDAEARPFDDTAGHVEFRLDDAETMAREPEYSAVTSQVEEHARIGRNCLERARNSWRDGNVEVAWWWLLQAASSAGYASGLVTVAFTANNPSADPKAVGALGGTAKGQNASARRKNAADAFLALPDRGATEDAAMASLKEQMRRVGLGLSDSSAMRLRKEHPAVDRAISSLPKGPRRRGTE